MALFSPHSLALPPSYLPKPPPRFLAKSDHFSSVLAALSSRPLKAPRNFPLAAASRTFLSSSSQAFAVSETEEDGFEEFDDITDMEDLEDFDFEGLLDEEAGDEDELDPFADSPWEGAVMYQRNAASIHVDYATSLERLGLEALSAEVSRQRAAAMGIRMPPQPRSSIRTEEDEETDMATPVLVSVDVTRRRRRLRLDGIVRTVIALSCYECSQAAPHPVFSNFSLLLSEDPVEEPPEEEKYDIYRERKPKVSSKVGFEEYDEDNDIDWEDRLHFPSAEKEIDISKQIRDIVHLAIRMDVVCSPDCKGSCLSCGTNLNWSSCTCVEEEEEGGDGNSEYGPFKELLKQAKQKKRQR